MTFVYNHAKHLIGSGGIDLSSDDLRVALVMTNTTADTEDDVTTMDGFTTLDEFDGSPYSRQALAGESYAKDAPNNRSEFDANDTVFTDLGNSSAGTRDVAGAILYKHVNDDTDSIPVAFYDDGFPRTGNGPTLTLAWNAEGVLQVGGSGNP